MSIGLDYLYYRYTIKLQTEWWDLKPTKNYLLFHLVRHSMNTMGHPYGKLKHLELLQVHYLGKMSIGLDSLYYRYAIKLQTEWQDPNLSLIHI